MHVKSEAVVFRSLGRVGSLMYEDLPPGPDWRSAVFPLGRGANMRGGERGSDGQHWKVIQRRDNALHIG